MSADTSTPVIELPADLAAVAAAGDAQLDGQAVVPGQEPPPAPDQGAQLSAMLQMGVAMVAPALPFLPRCYPVQTCDQIGTAFAAVAEKRGWDLNSLNTPELALAVVTLPPTIAAVVQGRAYFAAKKAEAEAAERAKSGDASAITAPDGLAEAAAG